MMRAYLFGGLAAGLLLLGPVGWRVLTWERLQPVAPDQSQAQAGAKLFSHEWTAKDPLSGRGDGVGPIFNASSCVACHHQGGIGGGGGVEHNVTTYVVLPENGVGDPKSGVLHAMATSEEHRETLKHLHRDLPAISQPKLASILPPQPGCDIGRGPQFNLPPNVQLSQRNTPALFGANLIDAIPDQVIIANERKQRLAHGLATGESQTMPVGRVRRLADGGIGRFGWKGQTAHLKDFVEAACANELGLSNPNHDQARSLAKPSYVSIGLDLTQAQCDELTAFVASLPRPTESGQKDPHATAGKALFTKVGCAECHTPNLGSVDGIFSDLLMHRMGDVLQGAGDSYGGSRQPSKSPGEDIFADEWRTPPLWGVASSAPYMHDGRAATLEQAIQLHGGQAAGSARQFELLRPNERVQLIAFLRSMKAP